MNKSIKAPNLIALLFNSIFKYYGLPTNIILDYRALFTSKFF